MQNIKTKWTLLYWLKIGYCNWESYKDRKQICYHGKHVLFDWNKGLFNAVLLMQRDLEKNAICKE